MEEREKIKVWIEYENGKTVCICKRNRKKCKSEHCLPDIVERDKFEGWEELFHQNRYGK